MRTLISKMNKGIVLGCHGHLLHSEWQVLWWCSFYHLPTLLVFGLFKPWDFFKINFVDKPRLKRMEIIKRWLTRCSYLKPHYSWGEIVCEPRSFWNFKFLKELANVRFFSPVGKTSTSGGGLCTISWMNIHEMCRITVPWLQNPK